MLFKATASVALLFAAATGDSDDQAYLLQSRTGTDARRFTTDVSYWLSQLADSPEDTVTAFGQLSFEERKSLLQLALQQAGSLNGVIETLPEASRQRVALALRQTPFAHIFGGDKNEQPWTLALQENAKNIDKSMDGKGGVEKSLNHKTLATTTTTTLAVSKCVYGRCTDNEVDCQNTVNACTTNGMIALTIDDDIDENAMKTAKDLNELGIKATFFVSAADSGDLGDFVTKRSAHLENIAKVYALGHQVSSHTEHHCCLSQEPGVCPDVFTWGAEWQICNQTLYPKTIAEKLHDWANEVKDAGQELKGSPGKGGWYFVRPPFMGLTDADAKEVETAGYTVAWITDDTNDWKKDDDLVRECLDSVVALDGKKSSHITLQHGRHSHRLSKDYWASLLATAKQNGWRFVTMDECAGV